MNLLLFKAISLLAVLLVTTVGVLLPYIIRRRCNGPASSPLAIAHSLVGGVFVGAALLHLLPDAIANSSIHQVLVLVLCGLMFADICETITMMPNTREYVATAAAVAISRKSTADFVYVPEQSYRVDSAAAQDMVGSTDVEPFLDDVCHQSINPCSHRAVSAVNPDVTPLKKQLLEGRSDPTGGDAAFVRVGDGHGNGVHHHHIHVGPGTLSWVIAFMLSIHAVVTGAALGFANSVHDAMILAIVIVAHKGVEAFAVSFNFAEERPSCATTGAIIFYSLMTPLGAILATVTSQFMAGPTTLQAESVLEAFATGNFLYVGMMHLQDKSSCRYGWFRRKVLPELFGAGLMWLVSLWV